MERALALLATAALSACAAAGEGTAPAPADGGGPAPLRVLSVETSWSLVDSPLPKPLLSLLLEVETGSEDTLLSATPWRAEAAPPGGGRVATEGMVPGGIGFGRRISLHGIRPGATEGVLDEIVLDLLVVRVASWREYERTGVMDGGLDEMECPPWRLRFAGEEAFWVDAALDLESLSEEAPRPPIARHVAEGAAAASARVTDARGRTLRAWAMSERTGHATATFEVPGTGDEPPDDPVIAYPVTVRFRVPEKWTLEPVRLVLRDVPLPPPGAPGE